MAEVPLFFILPWNCVLVSIWESTDKNFRIASKEGEDTDNLINLKIKWDLFKTILYCELLNIVISGIFIMYCII
jgi:hypothetical protein